MSLNTSHRSSRVEMMDDMELTGDLLADTLDGIAKINRQLGGNRVTVSGVKKLLEGESKDKTIGIVDLGCGNGDILRRLADLGRETGWKFKLIGIDLNAYTIAHAESMSTDYPEISYRQVDVFSKEMEEIDFDIALSTLFLHHFGTPEIEHLLQKLKASARIGIVVNDLHRHWLAYRLFQAYSLSIRNEMIRHDGLVSILRAFKRADLESVSRKLKSNSDIRWKWAFRFQWIIKSRCQ